MNKPQLNQRPTATGIIAIAGVGMPGTYRYTQLPGHWDSKDENPDIPADWKKTLERVNNIAGHNKHKEVGEGYRIFSEARKHTSYEDQYTLVVHWDPNTPRLRWLLTFSIRKPKGDWEPIEGLDEFLAETPEAIAALIRAEATTFPI